MTRPASLALSPPTAASTQIAWRIGAVRSGSKNIEIIFYGRGQPDAGEDFSIVLLPGTQYYTQEITGASMKMVESQLMWLLLNAKKQNIAFVLHPGAITQNGNRLGNLEWRRTGPGALYKLENTELGGLPEGVPYAVCVGNHDLWRTEDGKRTLYFKTLVFCRSAASDALIGKARTLQATPLPHKI